MVPGFPLYDLIAAFNQPCCITHLPGALCHRYMLEGSWLTGIAVAAAQVFFKSPAQGAETSVYLASSAEVGCVQGGGGLACVGQGRRV